MAVSLAHSIDIVTIMCVPLYLTNILFDLSLSLSLSRDSSCLIERNLGIDEDCERSRSLPQGPL